MVLLNTLPAPSIYSSHISKSYLKTSTTSCHPLLQSPFLTFHQLSTALKHESILLTLCLKGSTRSGSFLTPQFYHSTPNQHLTSSRICLLTIPKRAGFYSGLKFLTCFFLIGLLHPLSSPQSAPHIVLHGIANPLLFMSQLNPPA